MATPHYLSPLFDPKGIVVFGASPKPEKVGGRIFENLVVGSFDGPVVAVNPGYSEIGGRPCVASLQEVRDPVDLAVVATRASTVPDIVRECGAQGINSVIVSTAGFGDGDKDGPALRAKLLGEARRSNIRLLGPNCLGLLRPGRGINASFSENTARPGSLALVSQSGALCTSILDWAADRPVGFSAVVSMGDAADVGFGELLDFLAVDAATSSILLYIEGIRNPRRFMSGLRVAARLKPVIVVKTGRHPEGARAAISHTSALVGADDVFDAALRRAGVVRVRSVEDLFASAELLSAHHRVRGNRLGVVTNGGGLGVLATDRAVDLDLNIAALGDKTMGKLDEVLPAHWSKGNPVDIIGDAGADRYSAATQACLDDPEVDGVLVMLSPQAMTEPTKCAEAVIDAAEKTEKPVLTCWMGGKHVEEARRLFSSRKIPTFHSPEASVEAFGYLAAYHQNQKLLRQVPGPVGTTNRPDAEGARLIIEGVLAARRRTLTITESKALLAGFHIPIGPGVEARTPNDALVAAQSLGFPVAMKIHSPDITHKSDVDGVHLNITGAAEVRGAFNAMVERAAAQLPDAEITGVVVEKMIRKRNGRELFVGVTCDPVFGPVLGFGAGGTAIEIIRDRTISLPPINRYIARQLISRTRIARALESYRGLPAANLDAVADVLCRVSEMVCELPEIVELDINPLIVDEDGVVAVDARVVVDHPAPDLASYGHMAIHPYPWALREVHQLADGVDITVRPIRPEDATIEQAMIRGLSERSRFFRFMNNLNELTPEMLVRFTQIDYDREMAFIAVTTEAGKEVQLGVVRYVTNPDGRSCEFALVVADAWQRRGIGRRLMQALINTARSRGLKRMVGEVLIENAPMLSLVKSLGFRARKDTEDPGLWDVDRDL